MASYKDINLTEMRKYLVQTKGKVISMDELKKFIDKLPKADKMAKGGVATKKKKGMARGGASMMKKKGMARGGATMKKKGYAKGGAKMPMVKKGGKMIPAFAADGKGKMNKGGMTKKKKGMAKGGMMKKKKK